MTTSLPTSAQLHVADQDGKYIFVHPETNFDQVIDTVSGKKLKEYLAELGPGGRVEINKFPFSLTAAIDGQTEFEFPDTNYDPLTSYITVHLNGEFLHPVEEYNVVKEIGKNPKVILEVGVPAGNRIHIVIERGIIVDGEDTPAEPTYPPFSNGYIPTGKKYGVSINKTEANPNNSVQYIEDAVGMIPAKMNFATGLFDYGSWKDIWFVKDNYPVMLNNNGTEAFKLDPTDYSKKVDGTSSNIGTSPSGMDAMSCIPKVFIKQWEDTTHEYVLVSDIKHDDTWNAFAHTTADGIVKDNLYLAIYKASLISSKYRSLPGRTMEHTVSVENQRAFAQANGPGWDIRSWSQRNLINALLLIIGKSTDGQTVFGTGRVLTGDKVALGSLDKNGQFYGYNDSVRQVKVFHMEGWWGDLWERITGILTIAGDVKVKMTAPYDFLGTDFVSVGVSVTENLSGFIKDCQSNQYGRIPKTFVGTSVTYTPDRAIYRSTSTNAGLVGGYWSNDKDAGPYNLNLYNGPSYSESWVGCAISYL